MAEAPTKTRAPRVTRRRRKKTELERIADAIRKPSRHRNPVRLEDPATPTIRETPSDAIPTPTIREPRRRASKPDVATPTIRELPARSAMSLADVASQLGEPRRNSSSSLTDVVAQLREPATHRNSGSSLADVAAQLRKSGRHRSAAGDLSLDEVATRLRSTSAEPTPTNAGPLDFVMPARPISMELVAGRGHYERVIAAVTQARTSVWIATANTKELMVEDARAKPGRRRSMKRASYVSILSLLDELSSRGVELRLLHAEIPSGPFREEIAQHPRLVAGGLAVRRCPRVHMKAVIVDGELMYLGSANWTGAGLGAKGSGRRNFELGIVTDDGQLLDQVQAIYERVWRGVECASCKLREECPGPLAELGEPLPGSLPAVSKIRRRRGLRLL